MNSKNDELSLMADVRSMLFDVQEKFEEGTVDSNRKNRRRIIDEISSISDETNSFYRNIRGGAAGSQAALRASSDFELMDC